MSDPRHAGSAPSSRADDEGVRVLRKPGVGLPMDIRVLLGVGLVVAVAVSWTLWGPGRAVPSPAAAMPRTVVMTPAAEAASAPLHRRAVHALPAGVATQAPREVPTPHGDPDDLASYFREGDDVPDTATLIKAMHQAGVRTGIGAFNPPGTSPPLEGLAVPADFALPPGYVRHHQVTDEGEIIEAILMFSPDLVLRDARGQPIPLPENRVVPPGLAPPGLPIRWVRPGKG